jgi:hypothetical protein
MPYCAKCGAKLDEGAKFCHLCGASVGVTTVTRYEVRRSRAPFYMSAIILIAILVTVLIVGALVFLPIRAVNLASSQSAPAQVGVDTLNLDFGADIAHVNVMFKNLTSTLVILNVSAKGGVGIFAPANPINITFSHNVSGNAMIVTSRVYRTGGWNWLFGLNVVCDLYIDVDVILGLSVRTSIGKIAVNTTDGVALDSLYLETTTGGIEAKLEQNVRLDGDVFIRTTTGGVDFTWHDVKAANNVSVGIRTTTGGIGVGIVQNDKLPANVTMTVEATIGGIDFAVAIHDGVGAWIESSTSVGGISVDKTGFSGAKSPIQSDNCPTSSNFIASLKTTTGGINLNAVYSSESSIA